MTCVEIDIDDYLNEASSSSLRAEIDRRIARKEWKWAGIADVDGAEPWTPAGMADDLRAAFYRRDASRFEMLLSILEPRQAEAA